MIAKARSFAKTLLDSSGPQITIEDLEDECMAKDCLISWLDPITGARQWFVRVEVSGLLARRLGPFTTREQALEFHDELCRDIVNLFFDRSNFSNDTHCFLEDGVAIFSLLRQDKVIERKGA